MGKIVWAISYVRENEGRFVIHPDDPGGATKFGFHLRYATTVGDIDGGEFDFNRNKTLM